MWLPETAVDLEVLDILASFEIRFTILSPYQAKRTRKLGRRAWRDASGGRFDPSMPYSLRLPSGRRIAVFFYDGPISQAIAFNLFLAFFPTLLIAVAVATSRIGGRTSLFDLIADLTQFLPPGSQAIVSEFLVKRGPDAWKIAALGWTGTLLAGSQVMKLVMQGIQTIYGDTEKLGFLHRQVRGLMLLLATIAPLLGAAILGVLGKPLRRWIAHEVGKHGQERYEQHRGHEPRRHQVGQRWCP